MRTTNLVPLVLALILSACATGPTGCYTLPTTEERVACLNAEAAYSAARHADYRAAAESGRRVIDDVAATQRIFDNISNSGRPQATNPRPVICNPFGASMICQ